MVSAIPRLNGTGGLWASLALPPPFPGISLVLRAEQQDQVPLLSTEASIKVMIHGRDHTPFLEHQGFSVRPGTETTIGSREVGGLLGEGAEEGLHFSTQPWGIKAGDSGTEECPLPSG